MPATLARTLGLTAVAMVVLALVAPVGANGEAAAWVALAVIAALIATYPDTETPPVRTDVGEPRAPAVNRLASHWRADRARAAILAHMGRQPVQSIPLLASFMRTGLVDHSELTPEAAPACLQRRVRALTDGRALELAELLGLEVEPR
ncbi:hypothetical protein [Rhodanobacter thiooxydans]|uniref:hypothetical protein n=1 Tax=Rhodanobacter thiooxydans TaxID=416169 RepID=UPI000AD62141|nr:hypothetical protein [Rhodanobacter thiooxydans]UJJ56719.1 hypothetical protein LRK53_19105 [Rhodanobacter thiooxydans]